MSPDADRTMTGWDGIMQQVSHGHSWSGQERNVCYLNQQDGTFANVSHVSGFDHLDDGRALGLVDWDRDGDLDVWQRNRTAPRLRLLRNERGNQQPWLSLTLEGTQANRDAIGAVVEVKPADGLPIVKSLRAGEFFMSQGSKALHFGLGESPDIAQVRVLWPGGDWETFKSFTSGKRYHLRQGSGKASSSPAPTKAIVDASPQALPLSFHQRDVIRLPMAIPLFPSLSYRNQALAPQSLTPTKQGRLLILWSSTCPACLKELQKLKLETLTQAGINVLALCVDPLDDPSGAYAFMDGLNRPIPWGFIDELALAKLDHWQQCLFDRAPTFSTPLTLILNPNNHVVAIQRGPGLQPHAWHTLKTPEKQRHFTAPPFPGKWFTNPVPASYVYEDFARRFAERFEEDGLFYLEQAATAKPSEQLHREISTKHERLARAHAEANRPAKAMPHFAKALQYNPRSAQLHHNTAIFYAQLGRLTEARKHFAIAVQLDPTSEASREALAMVEKDLQQK